MTVLKQAIEKFKAMTMGNKEELKQAIQAKENLHDLFGGEIWENKNASGEFNWVKEKLSTADIESLRSDVPQKNGDIDEKKLAEFLAPGAGDVYEMLHDSYDVNSEHICGIAQLLLLQKASTDIITALSVAYQITGHCGKPFEAFTGIAVCNKVAQ